MRVREEVQLLSARYAISIRLIHILFSSLKRLSSTLWHYWGLLGFCDNISVLFSAESECIWGLVKGIGVKGRNNFVETLLINLNLFLL